MQCTPDTFQSNATFLLPYTLNLFLEVLAPLSRVAELYHGVHLLLDVAKVSLHPEHVMLLFHGLTPWLGRFVAAWDKQPPLLSAVFLVPPTQTRPLPLLPLLLLLLLNWLLLEGCVVVSVWLKSPQEHGTLA